MMNKENYKLIVAGNINIASMINSIIAATIQLRKNNNDKNKIFNIIHIFHTEESLEKLLSSQKWKSVLQDYGIPYTSIIQHMTKIEEESDIIFTNLVEQLKSIINPFDNENYYIDLTSGVTSIKSIFAVFAYVVDIENIYTLEVKFSSVEQRSLFYNDLIDKNIEIRYKKFPEIKKFDDFGKLNYTEVIRHKEIINNKMEELSLILPSESDLSHLKNSLLSGVNSRLLGDITKNIDNYRQSIFASSASVEEMSNFILMTMLNEDIEEDLTLGNKLKKIRENYSNKNHKYFIDPDVLKYMTLLINKIRNKIVHHKNNISSNKEISKMKSYISSELSYAFLNFTIESLSGFIDDKGKIINISILEDKKTLKNKILYFGVDGDNTGKHLEKSFGNTDENEKELIEKSKELRNAIQKISSEIKKETKNHNSVLFAEGDNILFKGEYNSSLLLKIQKIYYDATGLSCSIGFGFTLKESSIALKLSKSKNGNGIVGVKLG